MPRDRRSLPELPTVTITATDDAQIREETATQLLAWLTRLAQSGTTPP